MAKTVTNVLLLTNFFGFLQIAPIGNLPYYQKHNLDNPEKQYSWKEMTEEEAKEIMESNNGIDPDFKTPAQALQAAKQSQETINRLQEEHATALQSKDEEIEKLRALLNQASQAPTAPGAPAAVPLPSDASNNEDGGDGATANATDVVAKIKAATSADEVKKLSDGDTRKTVQDAATKKLQEFQ